MNGREKVVVKNGPFSLIFCQTVALMLPHRSVVAGRLDEVLVAILFTSFVSTVGGSLTEGGEAPHRAQRKQEAEAGTGEPERITQKE